jgi:hypothetical protein
MLLSTSVLVEHDCLAAVFFEPALISTQQPFWLRKTPHW